MNRTIREIFGERLVLLRRRGRLSQPELAALAGMSVTALNRIENGHQSLYMEKVVALAVALGTSADFLLGLSEQPERPTAACQARHGEEPAYGPRRI